MSWWQWLLVGIGSYIAVGVLVSAVDAYCEGYKDSLRADPDQFEYSGDWPVLIPMWPLAILVGWIPDVTKLTFQMIYLRGRDHNTRKLARQGRKAQKQALKELCHQNGWKYRKVKATV